MDEQTITIPVGGGETMPATLRVGRNARTAILLISDIRGPSPFTEDLASRLALMGFAVLVPDFFFRQGPVEPDIESAKARRKLLDESQSLLDLDAAVDWLRAEFAGPRAGCLGFCMGATFALDLASSRTDLVTVAYYGFPVPPRTMAVPPPRPIDLVATLTGPVLAIWGDQDPGVGMENVHAYIRAAQHSGAEFEAELLPGLSHGFLARADLDDPSDPAAATWRRAAAHFRTHLASPAPERPAERH